MRVVGSYPYLCCEHIATHWVICRVSASDCGVQAHRHCMACKFYMATSSAETAPTLHLACASTCIMHLLPSSSTIASLYTYG
jgi:hypothetical protein